MTSPAQNPPVKTDQIIKIQRYALITAVIWSFLICGLFFISRTDNRQAIYEISRGIIRSATPSVTPIQNTMRKEIQQEALIHCVIWLIGIGLLWFGTQKIIHTLSLLRDERDRLNVSEEQLRVIFETSESGIILVSLHGVILFANRRMAEMLGTTLQTLIGSTYTENLHPTEIQNGDELMRQLIHGEIDSVSTCRRYIRKDGTDFWGNLSGKRLENTDGTFRALVGVIADITERKQAEEALSRSRAELKAIYEHAPVMMCLMGSDRQIFFTNSAFTAFSGFSEEELKGGKACGVFGCINATDDPRGCGFGMNCLSCTLLSTIEDTFKTGAVHRNIEYSTTLLRNGEERGVVLLGSTAFVDSTNQTVLLCLHDITDRKRTEEERQQLEQQFYHAQKLESLGVLAGGIAHDFNNILTVILGHCRLAEEGLDTGASSIKQIESAANRAADLCRQMLTYTGKSPLVQTNVNLWMLLDEVVRMLKSGIKKNVAFELNMKRIVPEINGDSGQIQQIIMNLIINAAEAIGEKNGTIKIALTRLVIATDQPEKDTFGTLIQSGNYICLEVTDNGSGMDEETKERIFEPFYTTKFTGRGLGMSAIRGIVAAHKSLLQLTSAPGIGTTFKIYFPLPEVSGGNASSEIASPAYNSSIISGTILLVEDELALRTIGTVLLESMGFSVLTAVNGREAIEKYIERSSEITMVMLDLIMPVMGGVEAYHKLRSIAPNLPVIICSGYGIESVEDIIKNDLHVCFEHKPYKPDQLRNAIMKMMP